MFVLCSLKLFKFKNLEENQFKPHRKVAKLKSKFSLILGKLNRALNNQALECYRVHNKGQNSEPDRLSLSKLSRNSFFQLKDKKTKIENVYLEDELLQ